jgi:putative chitinase
MINSSQLMSFVGKSDEALVDSINAVLDRFAINTQRRVRYFLTHAAFETQMFTRFEEDLWYSTPERLVAVWPKRFTLDRNIRLAYAPDYIKNPQKLANFVYGGRNGNSGTNDGWLYRGRGGFHLTFLDNYKAYSHAIYGDDRCVTDPELVAKPADAMMSAGWFWDSRGFNHLADLDQFTQVTTQINGSAATAPARLKVLNKANQIF